MRARVHAMRFIKSLSYTTDSAHAGIRFLAVGILRCASRFDQQSAADLARLCDNATIMKAAALLAPRQLAPHQLASLRRRLLASYRENRRDLPWRRSRDPYRIWLAEIMLQQTRIAAVLPYYISAYFRSILSLASEPWRTMFALAAMAGLRAGEVLGLSMDDLDFEQRLIFVRRSAWHGRLFSPKSARSVAALPMPEPLAEMLTNYLALWRPNEKRLLFPNRRGNPYSANKVVQKRLWPILDSLSIPRCGMHAFRHSHASLLISGGASPKVAQMQLRHSDAAITMRVYAHVLGSEQRDAAERVARQLWPDVATFLGKSQYAN